MSSGHGSRIIFVVSERYKERATDLMVAPDKVSDVSSNQICCQSSSCVSA